MYYVATKVTYTKLNTTFHLLFHKVQQASDV